MKAFWIKSANGGTALESRDIPEPEAKQGEIIVRMRAASLNRGELLAAIGHHSAAAARPAGGDGAGEVHAVGEGVAGFRPGDRVMFRARGTFAQYAAVLAEQAVPTPERLTWEQAASVPTVFVTAHESIRQFGKLKKGNWLLVAGASSGVGVACIQAAKYLGAKVIGTSGSAAKLEKLRAIGLDVGIEARGGDFAAQVLKATRGRGAKVAVNLVGGTAFPGCLHALANQGRLAIVGYVDGVMMSEIDLEAVHGKRLQIFGVSNAHLTPSQRARATRSFARELLPGFADGGITPLVDRVFPFDELPAAKAYVDSNAQIGKVVVRMS
ncbi:MAG: zinc-binding dehydrogenase [Betaproteobacteria bacterium]|nr:zinc-binding dehydrogenase [Betaproteobacteria bacterium]